MHDHSHHSHGHSHGSGNIKVAFFLNLAFTLIEIVGGLLTNSIAILSDALHDLGDSLSLGMAWFLDRFSQREGSARYSYGRRRFSLLGALLNSVVLIGGGLFVLSEAVPRLLDPDIPHAPGMIAMAALGVTVNGVAALRLKRDSSLNSRVVAWHLLEDVLGWAAVLIVGIVLLFADIPILDPILSILITLYVLFNAIRNLRETVELFLQAAPPSISVPEIDARLRGLPGVRSTHHTHVWSLDGEHHVLSTHVVLAGDPSRQELLAAKRRCREALGEWEFSHVTVELEFAEADCSMENGEDGQGTRV